MAAFYVNSSAGHNAVVETDFDATDTAADVAGDCDHINSLAIDPTGNSNLAFLACRGTASTGDSKVIALDIGSSAATSYSPETAIWTNSGVGTTLDTWRIAVAPNGLVVVITVAPTGSTIGYVRSIPMDVIQAAITAGTDLDPGAVDVMVEAFDQPNAVDFSPTLSVANPRPGTIVRGARRLHVVVREPTATSLEVWVDGVSTCTDTELGNGVSNACMLDASSWSSGHHEVTLTLTLASGVSYDLAVPYEAQ